MANPIWIVLSDGVPVEAQFASARGVSTPIVINTATGLAYYMNSSGSIVPLGGSAVGITDHGALTGLSDDDHRQYLNETRGDIRYAPLSHVGSGGLSEHDLATEFVAGFLDPNDKVILNDISERSWTWMESSLDFSTSSTVATTTPFSFTPIASKSYCVEGQLLLETNSISAGPVISLEFPTDVTKGMISLKAASSSSTEVMYHGTPDDPAELAVSGIPANTPLPAWLQIYFTTGSSPTGDFSVLLSTEA